ncbi:hypothetical protein [Halomarina rubra]|uniref:Uncharacterized protein n=1 Tax=Halomarina rubra TaxID=2071873 RepID=A0ABD6B029_9EURY|nr:hypothetical protein [Halomarina rubra]
MTQTTRDDRSDRRTDRRATDRRTGERASLADVDHTHPRTGESFGDAMVYHRGPTVAADGGTERSGETRTEDDETLADLDHTPPRDADDANTVHERGGEHEAETDRATESDEHESV